MLFWCEMSTLSIKNCHATLFTCFLYRGVKNGKWYLGHSGLGLHQLGSWPTFFILQGAVCPTNNPQSCIDPPKSQWHDAQRRINETGKSTRENTAFWTILRGGVRVQAWHAALRIEFAFGRLGVMTTQASWLAQAGRDVLIGQRACWLMT